MRGPDGVVRQLSRATPGEPAGWCVRWATVYRLALIRTLLQAGPSLATTATTAAAATTTAATATKATTATTAKAAPRHACGTTHATPH